MDYIYDVVLNFQPVYYEFYEWQTTDKIINIKRIPIYKITNQDYLNIKNNDIIIERNTIPKQNKIFLITSGIEIMGIMIDNNGKVIKKSSLLFEESDDILEDKDEIKIIKIKYNIINKSSIKFESRIKKEKSAYIKKYLNNLDKEKDKYFLKYLYYEIFTKDESNIDKIYNNLQELSNSNPSILYESIKKIDFELRRKNPSK